MSRRISINNRITLSDIDMNAKQGGKLLFTDYNGQSCALLIQDNRLKAARFFPRQQSKIGAIYICKVKNVVKNLNAYFVEIGGAEREICFLSQKDASHPFLLNRPWDGRILEGDEFPVQVIRDAQKTKQASVTTLISLSNEYFALSVGEQKTGYSNKFTLEEKKQLKKCLTGTGWELPPIPFPYNIDGSEMNLSIGLVVRTQAAKLIQNEPILHEHFEELLTGFSDIFRTALHRTCFSCLKLPSMPWQTALTELAYSNEYDEILTDNTTIYEQLCKTDIVTEPKLIRLYDEKQSAQLSLSNLYGLSSKLESALGRRVWLKSGGYLIIEPTEAMTVIDVNSGKYEAKKDIEETAYYINMEAAEEIALQLRLRNLSGIIIVDFINMKSKTHQNSLMQNLKDLVTSDKQKTTVIDMTPLGLVEITRKKGYKTLAEQIEAGE